MSIILGHEARIPKWTNNSEECGCETVRTAAVHGKWATVFFGRGTLKEFEEAAFQMKLEK